MSDPREIMRQRMQMLLDNGFTLDEVEAIAQQILDAADAAAEHPGATVRVDLPNDWPIDKSAAWEVVSDEMLASMRREV